jgi:hypothetical protein
VVVENGVAELVAGTAASRPHRDGRDMSGAIINITLPGEPRKNNDRWLRAVTEDARADTIRKAVTQMMNKPTDYLIGSKRPKPTWKAQPVVKGDEDEQIPGVVNETVARALDDTAELAAA